MRKPNALCKVLLHIVLVIAPLQGLAVSSFVELTNFQYSIRDLDLNDGIAPSLVFGESIPGGNVSEARTVHPSEFFKTGPYLKPTGPHLQEGTSAFSPVSASRVEPNSQWSASVSGDGSFGSLKLAASGSAGPGGHYYSSASAPMPDQQERVGPRFGYGAPFTVSANTEVTFSALGTYGGDGGGVWMELSAQSSDLYLNSYAPGYFVGGSSTHNSSPVAPSTQTLQVSFANVTGQAAPGWFFASVLAHGHGDAGPAAPIPEPSTYALMSIGLLMLAVARKRVSL